MRLLKLSKSEADLAKEVLSSAFKTILVNIRAIKTFDVIEGARSTEVKISFSNKNKITT